MEATRRLRRMFLLARSDTPLRRSRHRAISRPEPGETARLQRTEVGLIHCRATPWCLDGPPTTLFRWPNPIALCVTSPLRRKSAQPATPPPGIPPEGQPHVARTSTSRASPHTRLCLWMGRLHFHRRLSRHLPGLICPERSIRTAGFDSRRRRAGGHQLLQWWSGALSSCRCSRALRVWRPRMRPWKLQASPPRRPRRYRSAAALEMSGGRRPAPGWAGSYSQPLDRTRCSDHR